MIQIEKPIHRLTKGALDDKHGPDRGRRLITTLIPGDFLVLRPHATRRPEQVSLFDLYDWLIRCRVNKERLETARAVKAKKEARRKLLALARRMKHREPGEE